MKDIGYTFWSVEDGTTVNLEQLLEDTRLMPVKKISTEKLKERLINSYDQQRIKESDLTYPPIVLMSGSKINKIIDGNHRIQKSIRLGYKEIDAKLVTLDQLPSVYNKIFN